jgi:hypothetical protein
MEKPIASHDGAGAVVHDGADAGDAAFDGTAVFQLPVFATTWSTIEKGFGLDPHNTAEISKVIAFVHRHGTMRGRMNITSQLLNAFEKACHDMAARVKTADEFVACSRMMLKVCFPLDRLVFSIANSKENLATVRRSCAIRGRARSCAHPPPAFTHPQIMEKAWVAGNFEGPLPLEAIPTGLMAVKKTAAAKIAAAARARVDSSDGGSDAGGGGGGASTQSPAPRAAPAERVARDEAETK